MTSPEWSPTDRTVLGLNAAGLSLAGISRRTGQHYTTVAHRLKVLKVRPADTRRSFMDRVFDGLTREQQEWLVARMGSTVTVADLVVSLIVREHELTTPKRKRKEPA